MFYKIPPCHNYKPNWLIEFINFPDEEDTPQGQAAPSSDDDDDDEDDDDDDEGDFESLFEDIAGG